MIIQLLNGIQYDIEDYGLGRLFHPIPSAEVNHNTAQVSGLGEIITDTTIGQRDIPVDIAYQVKDIYDYYLLRDELNALFLRKEEFYIIFKREPYKRWRVKIADQYLIPPHPQGGQFSLKFRTVLKYAESIATTSTIKEWDEDLWWFNGSLTWDEPLKYTFNANTFDVVNLGTAELEPEVFDLKITIKAVAGSSLKIKNLTNNSEYQYNGSLTSSDTLLIDGIKSFKNGVSVFKDTTKTLVFLNPGVNKFEVTGGTIESIAFDFRFPFK